MQRKTGGMKNFWPLSEIGPLTKEIYSEIQRALAKINLPDNHKAGEKYSILCLKKNCSLSKLKKGYDKDSDGRFQRERLQPGLLDAFHRRFVATESR
jgi:hypothetical protein